MRHVLFASILLALSAGCQSLGIGKWHPSACAPEPCPAAETGLAACPPRCRTPRVEVEQPEEVVVRAPRQKIVVEAPCPAPCPPPQQAPPAPQQAPPAPQQAPLQQAPPPQQQAPPAPQQAAFTPMAAPQMMAGMMPMMAFSPGFAAPSTPVNAQVRERTGLGLTFDVFHLPIPYPKLITVQKPPEVSFQMPMPQPQPQAPAVPFAMAIPMANMMSAANMMMMPQASINYAQVTTQAQVPFQQSALVQGSASAQGGGQGAAPPAAAPPTPEQIKQTEQKLKELQDMCEKLRQLSAPKDKPCAPAKD
jgi:hypothetical protein